MDLGIFCKSTLDGELVDHCFSSLLGIGQNADPSYLDWLMKAWGWTLAVAGLGLLIALVLGAVMGTLRTLPVDSTLSRWLVRLATTWVELFRNIPILVQVFLWYHVIPAFIPPLKAFPSYLLVSIALGFFTSARIAEQVRAGIQSLPSGQRAAATALGLTTYQSYRYIILPMALRIVIPPLTSESMNLIKNSSVAFAVSVPELTLFAMQAQEETSHGVEIYLAVTLLYALSAFAVNRVMAHIEKRSRIPGFIVANSEVAAH
ncbi:amino acid ABC transporter permease [Polynucleobacter sp. UK-Kesae-W10]|uniref:amino acid ABC transporter permease n=1 Tax=Polynucleobacter sp. UK-Kesae-W10 TaxID=1819738 RepID=UPI001C0DB91A|nr:amino acid ABC transporter permease [Polynucleobacter sp. UK-Kesae-W10]MBU3577984.1 amino acid ABC transporter permease [Polynucleobacter sp. UK-Kesae-W10]